MYISNESHLHFKQEHLGHCFPVRTELICEMKSIWKSELSRWRKSHFVPNWLIQLTWKKKPQVSLQGKPCVLGAGASSTLFLCNNWVSFWKNTSFKAETSRGRKAQFVPNRPIPLSWKTKVSLKRMPSLLEAGLPSTLFPCVSWLSFWKESYPQLSCFKVEKGSMCCK
jgi:hypothetical protein